MAVSCAAVAGITAFTLCGCDFGSLSSGSSKTPYEVATQLGYDGSEASWLASLSGADGGAEIRAIYDESVSEGY